MSTSKVRNNDRNRTGNSLIRGQMLYHLSYMSCLIT